MEKNQTSCPKAVCEKIFRTITFGPAFSTIRRISSRQQTANSSPAIAKHVRNPTYASSPNSDPPSIIKTTSPVLQQQPKPTATSKEGSEVPIKFDYTSRRPTPPTTHHDMVQSGKPIVSAGKSNKDNAAEKSKQHNYGDKFSAYIHRTRKRIMSHDDQDHNEDKGPKVDGHGHGHGHGGIGKDHYFSDYIDKTKRKIRTTSSIKDWSESFFKY